MRHPLGKWMHCCIGLVALASCCSTADHTLAEDGQDARCAQIFAPAEEEPGAAWAEPKSIEDSPHYWRRPGTIGALHAVTDMYVALYELRPRLSSVAFPAILRHHKFENGNREASRQAGEEQRVRRNKRRQFVYDVSDLEMQSFDEVDRAAMESDLGVSGVQEFDDCIEWHGKRGVIVKLLVTAPSLQSQKVEFGDRYSYFYVVKKEEGWRVVWWAED